MISVLIVDDHAVVRRALKQALVDEIRDIAFGETRDAKQALAAAAKLPLGDPDPRPYPAGIGMGLKSSRKCATSIPGQRSWCSASVRIAVTPPLRCSWAPAVILRKMRPG
jgi:CheY-like chemotaxis protein